ncbi:MAG: ABC transporter permease [Planctomycetes bacterium]|nr:ABC transporter permease [Planctomycetota bacterium]
MSFWKIAWRNIEQRALASSLTALSMALGVALMIAVIVIYGVAVRQFKQRAEGYHRIVGGKGGALQLVLSTVYNIGKPLYPIPYSYYEKFKPGGQFADVTEVAIPLCLGDSYEAPDGTFYRVVGTTPDLFGKIEYGTYDDGTPKTYEFEPGGRNFKDASGLTGEAFRESAFEAVVGSVVAAQSGLKLGDEVHPTHGIGGKGHKHEGFKIVGILKPTGTANDRAVFINIEGFYLLEGHASSHDEHDQAASTDPTEVTQEPHAETVEHHDEHALAPLPIEQREVTSILVLCNSPFGPRVLEEFIDRANDPIAQTVAPASEIDALMDRIVGPVQLILLVMTILIVIVAGISILVSIYNSMSERSHDIAVMRALGASRIAVMAIVLVESILLAVGGGLIGIFVGHALIGVVSPYVVQRTGVALSWFEFDWKELILIPGLVALASLVGFLPALAAYRTDVAKSLASGR